MGEEVTRAKHYQKEAERSSEIVSRELQELKRLQAHIIADSDAVKAEQHKTATSLVESEKTSAALRNQLNDLELAVEKERELVALERRDFK